MKLFYLLLAFSFITFPAYSQDMGGQGRGGRGQGMGMMNQSPELMAITTVEQIGGKMKLSDAEMDSMTVIYEVFYTDLRAAFQERNMEKFQALTVKRDQSVKALFNDEKRYREYVRVMEDIQFQQRRRRQDGN